MNRLIFAVLTCAALAVICHSPAASGQANSRKNFLSLLKVDQYVGFTENGGRYLIFTNKTNQGSFLITEIGSDYIKVDDYQNAKGSEYWIPVSAIQSILQQK